MSYYSTSSILNERDEGMLADLTIKCMRADITDSDLLCSTDVDATAIDKWTPLRSGVVLASAAQFYPLEFNLSVSGNQPYRWLDQSRLYLCVKWLKSLATGEISRPFLSQPEVDELVKIALDGPEILKPLYSITEFNVISSFIEENPFLIQVLKETHIALRHFFAENVLRLEHRTDPEVPGEHKLLLYVETRASIKEALKKLDEFEEMWWLDNLNRAFGKLLIDVEFL